MPSIGLLTLHIYIPRAHSLKDKRQVLRGVKEKLRSRFNVSVAETGFQDAWQRSVLSVATVSEHHRLVEEVLQKVEATAAGLLGADLVSSEVELL